MKNKKKILLLLKSMLAFFIALLIFDAMKDPNSFFEGVMDGLIIGK